MRLINSSSLDRDTLERFDPITREWLYNGLDTCVTLEVFENIEPQLDQWSRPIYEFSRDLQGPVLEMNMHGLLVDLELRDQLCAEYERQIAHVERNFLRLVREGIGWDIQKWNSPGQIGTLLYDVIGIKEIKVKGRRTANRDALEKIASLYYDAEPLINHVLFMRDKIKKVQTLRTRVDKDGRLRTSFNIAGTDTGRFSSSFSEFGASGGNLQNVEEGLRQVFVADKGMKFAYIDKEQAESRAVGAICWNLFRASTYLDACESGDLHTSVCKMAWPDVAWTGDLRQDRELADVIFYRQHSRRHMAKVLGHGTNYLGQPYTMRQHTKVDLEVISDFQTRYFRGFPEIPQWHSAVHTALRENGYLINLKGRKRWFHGRRTEPETQRKAVAYDPQSSVADILNTDMLTLWRLGVVQLMLQVHDAVLIQYPEELEDELLPKALAAMQHEVPLEAGRSLRIPNDIKVGWNWGNWSPTNPDGLKKWKVGTTDERRRERHPTASILDRKF